MNVTIKSKKKNTMMKRVEVEFEIDNASGTPKRTDVKSKLEALLSASVGTVLVVHMNQPFGQNALTGNAYQYDSNEDLERLEKKHRLKKNGLFKEPVKEEKKAEAAPAA